MFVVGAILLVVFALLGGAMLEVGQWFQHRRALQVRTDAAALAGGQLLNECLDTAAFSSSQASSDIEAMARNYGGITSAASSGTGGGPYNPQFGNGISSMWFQSSTYPSADPPHNTNERGLGDECANLLLDVKMTQAGIPPFLSISPFATVHGWAQVELQSIIATKPTLPLAIPSFELGAVGVTFVDESVSGSPELQNCTGSIVPGGCTYALNGPAQASAPDGETVHVWSLSGAGVNFPIPSAGGDLIGVRVSVGSEVGDCAGTGTNDYACVDLNGSNGIVGVRDYPTSPSGLPALYQVWPSETCSPDTSPFFSNVTGVTTCPSTLQARIDFGTGSGVNPETSASGPQATVTADVGGTSVTMHAMSFVSGTTWLWQGTTSLPVDAAAAQSDYPITLSWKSKGKVGGSKQGDLGGGNPVQRFTSATDDNDGPVKMISLSDGSGNSAYSQTPGTHSIDITVAVANQGITNELTILRGSHNGSATAFILCTGQNGTPGVEQGIENGCTTTYQINPTNACPDPANPDPPDCAANKASSDNGNLVPKSLNNRFSCGTADQALNYWPDYTRSGDPRAVTLVLTTYDAFAQNGKQDYPVIGFGDFYIAGFSGSKCPQTGQYADAPAPPGAQKSDIWGYFIKYARGGSTPSGQKCVVNELGTCVATLIH